MIHRGVIAIDEANRRKTYARACMASSTYMLVRVPFDPATDKEDLRKLSKDERRFVRENVTPEEYRFAKAGKPMPVIDRSR